MSCLKDILMDTFDVSTKTFYDTPLNLMDTKCVEMLKYCIKESLNSKEYFNSFVREFSTIRIELDDQDKDTFFKYIIDRSLNINVKFKFNYTLYNSISDTVLLCSHILKCIDNELSKPGSYNSEIFKLYNVLKTNVLTSYKNIACKLNIDEKYFNNLNVSFIDSINFLVYPYINCRQDAIIVNGEDTNMPVSPDTLYKFLFNQDSIIRDLFTFDNHLDEDAGAYSLYRDEFLSFATDMIKCDKLPNDIIEIYIKTVVTMQLAFVILQDYLLDIQDFCKKYYLACTGEYKFEVNDKFNLINESDYPSKFIEMNNKFINTSNKQNVSLEADSDAGALSSQSTSITPTTTTNNMSLDQVDEKYKQKSLKLQKLINVIFKVNKEKFKAKINQNFFKKWIGRVPSLYQHYGNSAQMYENRMKGDPTEILLNGGVNYIKEMTSRTESIFNELINTCKKVTSAGDIHGKVNAIKGFCKQYPIEDLSAEPKTIKQQIVNEACYRIADAILQDNGVYGYTAEGIVGNKKFPTSNHIVTSLFVDNAQEKAEEQSVSNIFSSPDSITIFANPEKLNVLESGFRQTTNAIMSNFNPRMISATQKNMHQNYKLYVNNLTRKNAVQGASEEVTGDINQTKKIAKALEDGLIDALDIVIEQKKRCIQCVGSMYEMGGRISNLAKRCIAAMHDEEAKRRDDRYNTGSNTASLNRSTKRSSKQNLYNSGQNKSYMQLRREAEKAKLEAARNR